MAVDSVIGRWTLSVGRWTFLPISVNPVSDPALFRRLLLAWYRKRGRDLPWRRTTDPYPVLVSEFMLQQTQVATVIPYYDEWMRRFPDFAALASASEHEVLHAWQGLGYYARARNLRATAQTIMEKYGGRFPESLDAIRDLPGVGRYTANAVATFAFNRSVPIVEANIARLLARLFDIQIPIDTSRGREALWQRASDLLPNRNARLHNSALMDLGALVCGTRPNCVVCPVRNFCRAEEPAGLPMKRSAPVNHAPHGASRLFGETGPRLARAIAGSLARDVDAAKIGDSPRQAQTVAHFGISFHSSSHHVVGVPAEGGRAFNKILPTLVSYRRASLNPVTFAPSSGPGDVDFREFPKTLRPGDSDLTFA